MKTLKLLAVLLSYPSEGMVSALPEIAQRLNAEPALRGGTQDALAGLLAELKREDLLDLQERYVAQFDAGRATSLHLFEHVHGDSRDRGQAMVDLNALYRRSGFVLAVSELPDYLPAVLEYLASRPAEEVHDLLEDCVHILRAVGERLLAGGSPYAAVFAALLDLHRAAPLAAPKGADKAQLARSLDEEWDEAAVEFGPPSGLDAAAAHGVQQSRPQFIRFVPKNP
ncbi:MAG: nitrate reductase molybdenum cofactor assembly chaperone [Burkholderiales bacterium]|nr:nitrate reductase molybdenum cofactor assembly chaperone [Burkholderiales bacterium]